MTDKKEKSEKQWETCLTPEQYQVLRKKGTERPFTGKYYDFHEEGVYLCAACGNELFGSDTKFDSGTGWPSYFAPVGPGAVVEETDNSLGMRRVEVNCANCGSHLGHVFDDGPAPTGKRFCINSVALKFQKKPRGKKGEGNSLKKAAFGAGCFWGVEKVFAKIPGVVSTQVGYAGGSAENPGYAQVCTGRTGHAEAVEVTYDPAKVSYGELLITFWEWHDPTTLNRQGPDVGSQYRSVIFTHDRDQAETALRFKKLLAEAKVYSSPIVTEIVPAGPFYTAEEYHQKYLEKNPSGYCSHHLQSRRVREVLKGKL